MRATPRAIVKSSHPALRALVAVLKVRVRLKRQEVGTLPAPKAKMGAPALSSDEGLTDVMRTHVLRTPSWDVAVQVQSYGVSFAKSPSGGWTTGPAVCEP